MLKRTQKQGFTLIELLVVIAIIAILAAILFPVFARAREKARQTTCSSNQRQIAANVSMYVQDHEETFQTSNTVWTALNLDPGVTICPTKGKNTINAYAFNGNLCEKSIGDMVDPTATVLLADATAANNIMYIGPGEIDLRHSSAAILAYADGHVAPVLNTPIIAAADTNICTGLATGVNMLTVDPNSAWTESDNNGGQVANYYARYNATGGFPVTNPTIEIRANGDLKYVQATCDLTSSKITKPITLPSPHYWMLACDMKINNSQGGAGITVGVADASSNLIGKVYFDLPNNGTPIAQNMSLNGTTLYAYDRGTSDPRYGYKPMKIIGSAAGITLTYFDKSGAPFIKTLPVMSGTTWNSAKYVILKINSSNSDPRIWASNTMFGSI